MASATVRITKATRDILRRLARETGEPMRSLLDKAVEAYRRQRLLEETNKAYAALRADREAWEEEIEERRAWDDALADEVKDR